MDTISRCRYCLSTASELIPFETKLINPCDCKDQICQSCLQEKINQTHQTICEICQKSYVFTPEMHIVAAKEIFLRDYDDDYHTPTSSETNIDDDNLRMAYDPDGIIVEIPSSSGSDVVVPRIQIVKKEPTYKYERPESEILKCQFTVCKIGCVLLTVIIVIIIVLNMYGYLPSI